MHHMHWIRNQTYKKWSVMYVCPREIDIASFYDCSSWFWNCWYSVIGFFFLFFILTIYSFMYLSIMKLFFVLFCFLFFFLWFVCLFVFLVLHFIYINNTYRSWNFRLNIPISFYLLFQDLFSKFWSSNILHVVIIWSINEMIRVQIDTLNSKFVRKRFTPCEYYNVNI